MQKKINRNEYVFRNFNYIIFYFPDKNVFLINIQGNIL